MEKESNFQETWKMRIWMFLKMVNWICKKYCGFVAVTGCFFGTIELYVMTTDPILTTEVPVQISIAQKDYEMLLPGTYYRCCNLYFIYDRIQGNLLQEQVFSRGSLLGEFLFAPNCSIVYEISSVEGSVYDCWLCGAFPVRFFRRGNSTTDPKN